MGELRSLVGLPAESDEGRKRCRAGESIGAMNEREGVQTMSKPPEGSASKTGAGVAASRKAARARAGSYVCGGVKGGSIFGMKESEVRRLMREKGRPWR